MGFVGIFSLLTSPSCHIELLMQRKREQWQNQVKAPGCGVCHSHPIAQSKSQPSLTSMQLEVYSFQKGEHQGEPCDDEPNKKGSDYLGAGGQGKHIGNSSPKPLGDSATWPSRFTSWWVTQPPNEQFIDLFGPLYVGPHLWIYVHIYNRFLSSFLGDFTFLYVHKESESNISRITWRGLIFRFIGK